MPYPRLIPGDDGAGVIDEVGLGVSDDRLDERVWLYFVTRDRAFGTMAEYVVLPSEQAVSLPPAATFEDGLDWRDQLRLKR